MSLFVQQNATTMDFSNNGNDSWVILSDIERSIKAKIEAVGTPLKDWNIQINYGIKTGFNDAFIISTEKRNEILANCSSEDERQRTEELIRPILRGRDIKRYGYDWPGLWLIATFPSRHYDIEEYPAVKEHLLSFTKRRLAQSGEEYYIDGEKIKARKKTNNKWFETQDSISYWEDFDQPKIMYSEIVQSPRFYLDKDQYFPEATTFILTGEKLEYLIQLLNSEFIGKIFKRFYAGGGLGENGYRYKKLFLEKLPLPYNLDMQKISIDQIDREIINYFGLSETEEIFIGCK